MAIIRAKRTVPQWLVTAAKKRETEELRFFMDNQKFHDDIHGEIYLNQMERDLIDTPEFQRIFRISQLGFVDLTFATANHTRGAHSIAVCAVAKQLVDIISDNTARVGYEKDKYLQNENKEENTKSEEQQGPPRISFSSSVLISAGALLHDISQGPFSHDIEKKTHILDPYCENPENQDRMKSFYGPYPKHDDFEEHPGLYVALLNPHASVLARTLRAYSPVFWKLMQTEVVKESCSELIGFVKLVKEVWLKKDSEAVKKILPELLFHLLIFERFDDAFWAPTKKVATSFERPDETKEWGLGYKDFYYNLHNAWYQPYRHDIIGNTLSVDLIDYLLRDMRRLGIDREINPRILAFYVLAPESSQPPAPASPLPRESIQRLDLENPKRYRCVLDLNDYKRGTPRIDLVNEIFRLLDLRFEIHEKAVFHRVVQANIAMLSRAVLLLEEKGRKIPLNALYGFNEKSTGPSSSPALCGEDLFLQQLIKAGDHLESQSIAQKLAERRVYRPLMVIPGDRVAILLKGTGYEEFPDKKREKDLRAVAAILDSCYFAPFFCFMSWCIEKLLEHAFDSTDEVRQYVGYIRNKGGVELAQAMKIRPKRVIFWALPYKQLHKDPAIYVRVGGMKGIPEVQCSLEKLGLGEADQLRANGNHEENDSPWRSLRLTVDAGIANAARKYESLWKLFLYLSDGLFYTGVLAKLLDEHPCAGPHGEKSHKEHLRQALGLSAETLRAAMRHWKSPAQHVSLKDSCPEDTFSSLLGYIERPSPGELADYPPIRLAERASAVAVRQYLHAEAREPHLLGAPEHCRDARYKFGKPAEQTNPDVIVGERKDLEKSTRSWLCELFKHLQQRGLNTWTEEELKELVDRLHVIADTLPEMPPAWIAAPSAEIRELLKAVWHRGPGWEQELKRYIEKLVEAQPYLFSEGYRAEQVIEALRQKLAKPSPAIQEPSPAEALPPLMDDEVFKGIMDEYSRGSRGPQRFQVFADWAKSNGWLPLQNLADFLRWLRTTLQKRSYRLNWVYSSKDLDIWYEEFREGKEFGRKL